MRFLVDECTGPSAATWLRNDGHEVYSVHDEARGTDDFAVLQQAWQENWVLVTNDKDFGERVYREKLSHHGIVLLRLRDERPAAKIEALRKLLENHADQLHDRFVVVTESAVRFSDVQSA